jgi:hypothetical protein
MSCSDESSDNDTRSEERVRQEKLRRVAITFNLRDIDSDGDEDELEDDREVSEVSEDEERLRTHRKRHRTAMPGAQQSGHDGHLDQGSSEEDISMAAPEDDGNGNSAMDEIINNLLCEARAGLIREALRKVSEQSVLSGNQEPEDQNQTVWHERQKEKQGKWEEQRPALAMAAICRLATPPRVHDAYCHRCWKIIADAEASCENSPTGDTSPSVEAQKPRKAVLRCQDCPSHGEGHPLLCGECDGIVHKHAHFHRRAAFNNNEWEYLPMHVGYDPENNRLDHGKLLQVCFICAFYIVRIIRSSNIQDMHKHVLSFVR